MGGALFWVDGGGWENILGGWGLLAFIQAVLLMSVFEQRLSFRMFNFMNEKKNDHKIIVKLSVWMCLSSALGFMAEPWWDFRW